MLSSGLSRMILLFESNVNSVTSGDGTGKGIVGDISEEIKNGIVDGFAWLGRCICEVVFPVMEWGCKLIIIGSIIVFFCSRDTKSISVGIKFFLAFIVLCFLEGLIF